MFEGGLRVPLLARWPGVVEPGSRCDALVGLSDLAATVADVLDYDLPSDAAPDSTSFLPLLKNPKRKATRETLVMQSPLAFAVRHMNWKLALTPASGARGQWGNTPKPEPAWRAALDEFGKQPGGDDYRRAPFVQLFDLDADVRETTNLASKHPEIVEKISAILDEQIANGRSTPGGKLKNDVAEVHVHRNAAIYNPGQ